MTARAPEQDVAKQLQAKSLGNFDGGGTQTIKLGLPRGVDEPGMSGVLMFVSARGGPPPVPYFDAVNQGSIFTCEVQVVVRTGDDDQGAGLALARQVRDALHVRAPTDTALGTYVACTARNSEPIPLPQNGQGQWEFSLNFLLTWAA